MNQWSHGYNVSMGYTYGFHAEMAPDWLDLCARVVGYVPRRHERPQKFRYLELGSGQGVGLCLLAAANPDAEFLGVDFLPEHITHSEGLAEAAGLTNVRFVEGDFAELAVSWPKDFGKFDYVALHGIYSWVSTEMRKCLLGCLLHATKSGTLVYNSYNSQPGWLGTVPFQHITQMLSQTTGKDGPTVTNLSINLFEKMRAGNAAAFQFLPAMGLRLDRVKSQRIQYLIQEYLHDNWHIHWHSAVARELADAKLNFVGSATLADNLLPALMPPPLREVIAEQQTPALKEDLQDIAVNQSFRRDIFARGARRSFIREAEAISEVRLVLIVPQSIDKPAKVDTTIGDLSLPSDEVTAVCDALKSGPKAIADLLQLPALAKLGRENALQFLIILLHSHRVGVEALEIGAPESSHRMNAAIARGAAKGAPYDHIAAPVLGSAIHVSKTDILLIDCWLATSSKADVATLAKGLSERLTGLGRNVTRDKQVLTGAQAEQRLEELAKEFLENKLPRWRALGALA